MEIVVQRVAGENDLTFDIFDVYKDLCEVVYLPRTRGVSVTALNEQIWL